MWWVGIKIAIGAGKRVLVMERYLFTAEHLRLGEVMRPRGVTIGVSVVLFLMGLVVVDLPVGIVDGS